MAELYLERHAEVEGWLDTIAARATDALLQAQTQLDLRGNVAEIGVHHGRYLILLANGLTDGESAVAVDLFANQSRNTTQSGRGTESVSLRYFMSAMSTSVRFLT